MNHLEKHELLAVLKIAREHSELDWLLFAFQYIHSHRISEVLALTPENFDGGYVTVQRLKGSLKTVQPLVTHDEPLLNERAPLEALIKTTQPKERLFGTLTKQNANYRFAKYATVAGLPKRKRHTPVYVIPVRHTRLRRRASKTFDSSAGIAASQVPGSTFERPIVRRGRIRCGSRLVRAS